MRCLRSPILTATAVLLCGLTIACGPTVGLDTSTGNDSDSTSSPTPSPTTTTTSANPTTAGETMVGPQDTGVGTSEPWLDLPEDCSLYEQDCPPGFKCMPWGSDGGPDWNDTRCVPVADDPGAPGDPCTVEGSVNSGIDDCDIGVMCWHIDPETNEGVCVEQCGGSPSEPTCNQPCHQCALSGSSVLDLCLLTCDPIAQNCLPGDGCYPVNDRFICVPDASRPGTGIGSPCEFINVCPPGLFCLDAAAVPGCEGFGCCAPACPADGIDPCPDLLPGTECMAWFEAGQGPGDECVVAEPGVCVVPM